MNRKGFTIIELIVAFAVMALISAIAVVSFNGILDQTEEKYYHTLENNLKLSGNNYFTEHRDRLPINAYNSISVKELIDNNYIEPLKDIDGNMCSEGDVYVYKGEKNNFDYEVCLRCGNYESTGKYCGNTKEELENKNLVRIPTSSLCKRKIETTYTGSAINLVENIDSSEHFTLLNTSYTEANENGYRITARLKSGYTWSDNTQEDKYFLCNLYKRTPDIIVSPIEGVVLLNKTGSFEEEANVTGSFRNTLEGNNATISYNNEILQEGAKNTVTVSGTKEGKGRVIIEFIPVDTKNYNSLTIENGALVYNLEVTNSLLKPTKEAYCRNNLVYNGNEQVLTIDAPEGVEFQNNRKTNAGSYEVIARLTNRRSRWVDGTADDVEINCSIEKKEATITLSEDMLEVVKDGRITFTEKANVVGTFSNIISDTTKANIEPMINSDVNADIPKNVTITGKNATDGTINVTVNFVPTGESATNYKETTKTIELRVLKKAIEPNASGACKKIIYDGTSQLLTNNAGTGYIYSNNYGKNAGDYTVKLTLQSGYRWEDNTTGVKTITCSIEMATPVITFSETSGTIIENQNKTFTATVKSGSNENILGTMTVGIGSASIVEVRPISKSVTASSTGTSETITITGVNPGESTITVNYVPNDTANYNAAVGVTYNVTTICNAGYYVSGGSCIGIPTSTPTATSTPRPTATNTPRPTATSTPGCDLTYQHYNSYGQCVNDAVCYYPCSINTYTWESCICPQPTAANTPIPTATSTPRPTATNTPRPTATNTPRPTATNTPRPTATSTPRPTATNTPRPTATNTPRPTATNTPRPTATNTPRPTATNTPRPTATNTPRPTATPTKTCSWSYSGQTSGSQPCSNCNSSTLNSSGSVGSTCTVSISDPTTTYTLTCSYNGSQYSGFSSYNSCFTSAVSVCGGTGSCTSSKSGSYVCYTYRYTCS